MWVDIKDLGGASHRIELVKGMRPKSIFFCRIDKKENGFRTRIIKLIHTKKALFWVFAVK